MRSHVGWEGAVPRKQRGQARVNRFANVAVFGDGSRTQHSVIGGPIPAGVLAHVIPAPESMTSHIALFGLGQEAVEIELPEQISVTGILPAPLGKGQRLGWAEFLRKLDELVF